MSKNKKYPVLGGRFQPQNRPYFKNKRTCELCGFKSEKNETVVLDVQVNWFRGDDEVLLICKKCSSKKDGQLLHEIKQLWEAYHAKKNKA